MKTNDNNTTEIARPNEWAKLSRTELTKQCMFAASRIKGIFESLLHHEGSLKVDDKRILISCLDLLGSVEDRMFDIDAAWNLLSEGDITIPKQACEECRNLIGKRISFQTEDESYLWKGEPFTVTTVECQDGDIALMDGDVPFTLPPKAAWELSVTGSTIWEKDGYLTTVHIVK